MSSFKLTHSGDSSRVFVPKEALEEMAARANQLLVAIRSDGDELTPMDPETALQYLARLDIMRRYHEVFEALAK